MLTSRGISRFKGGDGHELIICQAELESEFEMLSKLKGGSHVKKKSMLHFFHSFH